MTESRFTRVHRFIRERRTLILILLGGVLLASVARLPFVPFQDSVDVMLPDGEARATVRFLTEASLADKVVVSVQQVDPAASRDAFISEADAFATSLQSPFLTPIDSGAAASGFMDSLDRLLGCAPQLFETDDLKNARKAVEPEAIDKSIRSLYEELTRPSSIFTGKLGRQDPLGISRAVLNRLQKISAAQVFDVVFDNGHLFSRDERNLLFVFTTPIAITDAAGTRKLVDFLDGQVAKLPPSLRATVVCGHLHTASNERILKHDIDKTAWIGALAFLAIFGLIFRDLRAIVILIIPVFSAIVALHLAAFCLSRLSYLVAGFGMVIVGIAVDYGIYAYVVTQRSRQPETDLQQIVRPVFIGMLATLCVFCAFFFSGIEGYRQLAVFSILSLLLACAGALFLLPHLVPPKTGIHAAAPPLPSSPVSHPLRRVIAFALILLVGVALMTHARFNTDITALDGTDRSILAAEKCFEKTWSAGGTEQGILAVCAPTYEEAFRQSEALFDQAAPAVGNRLLSFSIVWRSEQSRAANIARWNTFWTRDRINLVTSQVLESGKRYGFTAKAFAPFFDLLNRAPDLKEPLDSPLFSLIKDRFVRKSATGYTVFSFFPDTPECAAVLTPLAKKLPGAHLVSRRILTETLAASIGHSIAIITPVALLLVTLCTLLLSSSWRAALLSLTPAAAGLLWGLGVPAAMGSPLNLCHLTAAVVVFGLCVNYGIYMTHAMANDGVANGKTAIVLSAAAACVGAGVLLFATHPVLHAIGVTLTSGILVGFATSYWAMPALAALRTRRTDHQ